MGKKRVSMNKVREIIRLHDEMGLSCRKAARALLELFETRKREVQERY